MSIPVDIAKGNLPNFPLSAAEAADTKFIERLLSDNEAMLNKRAEIAATHTREVQFLNTLLVGANASLKGGYTSTSQTRRDADLSNQTEAHFISSRRALRDAGMRV